MIICDLIIDGNFILSKLVFTLNKNNILYGSLHQALDNAITNYRRWHPFANVYLVSDSKEKSWRKKLIGEYKSHRKKDSDIDWQFVYQAYSEFKEGLVGIKVMEAPHIEGDDWISYICNEV
jgi:5'-3' exonuclease